MSLFQRQLDSLRNQVLITNSLNVNRENINYELYKNISSEDMAWAAYEMAFEPEAETELPLYHLYYLLINRIPSLVKEVSIPALFRSSLLVPDFYPTLDSLLSNYF